jgi:hypothetical protein
MGKVDDPENPENKRQAGGNDKIDHGSTEPCQYLNPYYVQRDVLELHAGLSKIANFERLLSALEYIDTYGRI